MTPLRKRVAERLVEAQQNAAMLTTFNEIDMSAAMELRKRYQDAFVAKYGIKLGFMSFFVKAAVAALKEVPQVNAEVRGNSIVYHNYQDIGVAVGGGKGWWCRSCAMSSGSRFAEVEKKIADARRKGEKQQADPRGAAGRHLHHLERRHLRLAPVDPDPRTRRRAASWACTRSRKGRSPSPARW